MSQKDNHSYSHNWKDPYQKSVWITGEHGDSMEYNHLEPRQAGSLAVDLINEGLKPRVEPSQSENDLLQRGYITKDQMSDPKDWDS